MEGKGKFWRVEPVLIALLILAVIAIAVWTYRPAPNATGERTVVPPVPTQIPAGYPIGVTVHPQGELAPMPLDAVSPPYLVDRGDGKGPQVERGKVNFGEATEKK